MEYGPNTAEIEALIEKVRNLTPEQVESLGAARDAIRNAVWDAAWDAAGDAVPGGAWYAARGAVWDAARDAVWDAVRGAVWGTARGAVWAAVWGAVRALLAQDLISEEHLITLYGPWDSVMN